MKRLIALLLVLSVGVSLLTACAGKEPGAETGAVADPAATAPTEFLELRRPQETQAPHVEVIGPGKPHNGTTPGGERQDPVSLGILTPEQLADPQRIVTVGEAPVPETQRCAVTVQNEKSHPPVQSTEGGISHTAENPLWGLSAGFLQSAARKICSP